MSMDTELETWRQEWQSEPAVPPDLRRRVERQSRRLKIAIALDILVTVVMGGAVIVLAVRLPRPDMLVLAAATWFFIAGAWAFRLSISRGLWTPAAVNTAAFVDLSIRRCRAQMKAAAFGGVLYVCEIAFCLGWIYRHSARSSPLAGWLTGSLTARMVWVITTVFFSFLVRYRRKKRGELAWLVSVGEEE